MNMDISAGEGKDIGSERTVDSDHFILILIISFSLTQSRPPSYLIVPISYGHVMSCHVMLLSVYINCTSFAAANDD